MRVYVKTNLELKEFINVGVFMKIRRKIEQVNYGCQKFAYELVRERLTHLSLLVSWNFLSKLLQRVQVCKSSAFLFNCQIS